MDLPAPIATLCDELAAMRGVTAVVVGGSRATGAADADSDWDLGVYYRGAVDLAALARRGDVHPPGSWGRLMNGGAWLVVDGTKVDVLLRDVDVVAHWTAEAIAGRYEVDAVLGYVAGLATYALMAEAAVARPVRGAIAAPTAFPEALAATGSSRWRFHRDFSLLHAAMRARRGDVVGTAGHAARAVLEEAHARACEARTWVLNEKRLPAATGLDAVDARFRAVGDDLVAFVADVRAALGANLDAAPPPA